MGQVKKSRIIILIICFLLTGVFLFLRPESKPSIKKQSLNSALGHIKNWQVSNISSLSPEIVNALKLDDYLFQDYSNTRNTISLYIGYYFSSKKVGAAHDPLVCFPGQGWKLTDISTGKLEIKADNNHAISYSTMLATMGMEKTFLLYWFQSYDATSSNTFSQKLTLLRAKFLGKGEDNAFVRISVPMGNRSPEECKKIIYSFTQDFYPVFLKYVRGN